MGFQTCPTCHDSQQWCEDCKGFGRVWIEDYPQTPEEPHADAAWFGGLIVGFLVLLIVIITATIIGWAE